MARDDEKTGAAESAARAEPDQPAGGGDEAAHQSAQKEQLKAASRQEFQQNEEPVVYGTGVGHLGRPLSEHLEVEGVDATQHLPDGGDVSQHARRPAGFDASQERAKRASAEARKASDKARRAQR